MSYKRVETKFQQENPFLHTFNRTFSKIPMGSQTLFYRNLLDRVRCPHYRGARLIKRWECMKIAGLEIWGLRVQVTSALLAGFFLL